MAIIQQILSEKGDDVWTVQDTSIVYDALKLMEEKNIGSVLVVNSDNELVGILSERDYARKVVLKGKRSPDVEVREIMSTDPRTIRPDTKLDTCMELMTTYRIRHLPVLNGDKLVGVISIGDVVKAIIRNQQEMIAEMEGYIRGSAGF